MIPQLTAVIIRRGPWYVGYVEELPGVNTQARTLKRGRENLREALHLVLQANREVAENELGDQQAIREELATLTFTMR